MFEVGQVESATGAKKFLEGFTMAYLCMYVPYASEMFSIVEDWRRGLQSELERVV